MLDVEGFCCLLYRVFAVDFGGYIPKMLVGKCKGFGRAQGKC